jgi:outer membrane protein insertion porin family
MYSVRGYKYGSIGPKSQNYDGSLGSSFGGNLFYNFKNSLIIGNEYMRENNSRLVAFVDSGSVFNTSCIIKHSECDNSISTDDIKYSYGLAYVWYLPIGPISFSYALPINPKEEDRLESYQFSIGYAAF